jgi:hypothetical protein
MLTPAEQYRSLVELIDNPEQRYIRRMDETVVKPYIAYLKGLNSYLTEAAMSPADLKAVAQQAQQDPNSVTLPPQVQQNFAKELEAVPAGPVDGFNDKFNAELAKIQDPEVKQGLLAKAKEALKNPDHQQTILTAVSSIAGMVAGAASLGLGADAAKSATKHIGNGLLGIVNAKLSGKSWQSAIKHGAKVGATHAAADELGVNARDAKSALGIKNYDPSKPISPTNQPGQTAQGQVTAPPGVDPQALKGEWEKFVKYGQDLLSKMVPAPQAKPAE